MMADPLQRLSSTPAGPLSGDIHLPGDKSISHRALILASLTVGNTNIRGLLEGGDILSTIKALRSLGVKITKNEDTTWIVEGLGVGGLREPNNLLNLGNSGTSTRLILGALASHPITAFVSGDASLRLRPMKRVIEPLTLIGARFITREHGLLPLAIHGAEDPMPITYTSPIASAQIKSAILLAGLNTPGITKVVEAQATRDHTERMLRHFGAEVAVTPGAEGQEITLIGQPELTPKDLEIPGDFSSAAFLIVAALITPNSQLTLRGVGINPGRTGLITSLIEMGANLALSNERLLAGEPVADIDVSSSRLHGIEVPPNRAAHMIDEFPILSVAATQASGTTTMCGLSELRFKESNRLSTIVEGLTNCGVVANIDGDNLIVRGLGSQAPKGGFIHTKFDHRIAMSFLILGLIADDSITIDDGNSVATSFPEFTKLMNDLGALISNDDTELPQKPSESDS